MRYLAVMDASECATWQLWFQVIVWEMIGAHNVLNASWKTL